MTFRNRMTIAMALAGAWCMSAYGAKPTCSDINLSFTISPTYTDPQTLVSYTSNIVSDGLGAYINGQQGVIAIVTICNGADSATLTPGSARSVTFRFTNPIDTTQYTPSWTSAPVHYFYISNVMYNYAATATYAFTTYLKATFDTANDGCCDYFNMENPTAQAGKLAPDSIVNSPCVSSLVYVTHYPATGSSPETWVAWPDSTTAAGCTNGAAGVTQAGTLEVTAKKVVNGGQFRMPFYITMQRVP